MQNDGYLARNLGGARVVQMRGTASRISVTSAVGLLLLCSKVVSRAASEESDHRKTLRREWEGRKLLECADSRTTEWFRNSPTTEYTTSGSTRNKLEHGMMEAKDRPFHPTETLDWSFRELVDANFLTG